MRLPSYLVQSSTGVFHFRLIVPLRWRERLGRRVIKRSLGVRDPIAAQVIALTMAARYAQIFNGGGAMTKTPEELLAQMKGKVSKFEIDQRPDGTLSIRTNGTAEDNAAAMQMASVMRASATAPTTAAATVAPATPPAGNVMLRDAINQWLTFIEADTKPKTLSAKRLAVSQFLTWKKNGPLNAVTGLDVADFATYIRADVSKRTVTNRMIYLAGFFDWANQTGIYSQKNPARGLIRFTAKEKKLAARKNGWQAFTDDQMATLLAPANLRRVREIHSRWAAVIGAHTGARVSEVGQLALSNFVRKDGLDCIEFSDRLDGQSLKTDASRRTIPIHPTLLALGLMERVKQLRAKGETRLFPTLKGSQNGFGGAVSKSFSRYLGTLGVAPSGQGRLGFHSLRDTVISTLQRRGVSGELRRAYVGHEQQREDDHQMSYGEAFKPSAMNAKVCSALDWGLDVDALRPLLIPDEAAN